MFRRTNEKKRETGGEESVTQVVWKSMDEFERKEIRTEVIEKSMWHGRWG